MRLDADRVRAELAVERVLDAYELRAIPRGGWYRLKQCPRCGEASHREAIAVESSTGRWLHHGRERAAGGECSGDLLDLVAACEGIDARRDFPRVLARAAELAGITAFDDVAAQERAQRAAEARAAQEQRDRDRRAAAARTAPERWDALRARHPDGEAYLASRGIDAAAALARGVVRFTAAGDVCIAIRNARGAITSVATRFLVPGDRPKVIVLRGTSTAGTMVDAVADVRDAASIVIVEGVADAITAREAWPDAIVLGANGAGNVPRIAAAVIVRAAALGAAIALVPHDDGPGVRACAEAARIVRAAGLGLGDRLAIVDLPAKDLNDAWRAGWRPTRRAA